MSVRNGIALLLALSTLLFLAGCGSSSNSPAPVPPPSGNFSNANLNGTYVFSVSGTDEANSAPYAIVGTLTANGSGGITGGALDINDAAFAASQPVIPPAANAPINSNSTYEISVDGRGQAKLGTSTPFGNITLDFVLSTSSHGLVIEFDGVGTGSGTIDLQSAGTTPTGSYAFSFSGVTSAGTSATVGNFTLGSGGAIASGLEDFNDGGFAYTDQPLSGNVVVGPSSTPGTTLITGQFGTLIFDVYAIDATHLKFIEMDQVTIFSGDAYAQTSTTLPTGTLAFTLEGFYPTSATSLSAVGGFMVTDGAGNITNASSEDVNEGGSVSPSPITFTANYTAAPASSGRYTLSNFATGFVGGSAYAAYPSSGGLLLLEIDNTGIMAGAAYTQTAGATFAASQGYGLNLSGENLSAASEVDDIAEFAANSTGNTITGLIDENSTSAGPVTFGTALTSGTYVAPVNGRGAIAATAGTSSSNTTLNGGFALTFYTVDGTTFPFIETDSGQVSAGVFVLQNPSASSPGLAHPNIFVARPLVRPRAARQKKN